MPSDDPTIATPAPDPSSTDLFGHPEQVGPYRVLQVLGEGACALAGDYAGAIADFEAHIARPANVAGVPRREAWVGW